MSDYKLLKDKTTNETCIVIRKVDLTYIPFDEANTDYQEFLQWKADGGVPEEAD